MSARRPSGLETETSNKTLKRNVRARMAKTGERYTTARRQVLTKAQVADPPRAAEPFHGATNRPLGEWFALLENAGARGMPHADIVKWLTAEHDVPSWWRQDITVRYEKHIGRRVLGQRGSTFSSTATKVIAVPAAVAKAAWVEEEQRVQWLPDVRLSRRPSKAVVAARFDVNDGDGRVMVSFDARGEAKTSVAIEHEKLPDQATAKRWSTFWRERLKVLKEQLEKG